VSSGLSPELETVRAAQGESDLEPDGPLYDAFPLALLVDEDAPPEREEEPADLDQAQVRVAGPPDSRRAQASRHVQNGRAGERMRLTRIGDVAMRRITWLVDNLIPCAMLTGIVAAGGTVKGLFGIYQAMKLAERGETTLFLCSEDALEYIVRPRFEAAGCDAQLAVQLDIETETGTRNLRFPSDVELLRQAVLAVRPALVVIDPFVSFLDPRFDIGQNNHVRQALEPLIALARETGVAIVLVYHLGKDWGRGALGSVAFEDACRFVLTAAKDDEDPDVRHIEVTKSNVGPTGYGRKLRIVGVPLEIEGETEEVARLVDEGRSSKSVLELLTKRSRPGPEPQQRDNAKAALVEILVEAAGASVNAAEAKQQAADKAGVSQKTVWRAFDELKTNDLAGAAPTRDEHGSITAWNWYATRKLLLGSDA